MKLKLEPLRLSGLTNMEAGQLLKRHLSDLATLNPQLLTDAPFNSYLQALANHSVLLEKGLAQIRKNEETQKIEMADANRDKANVAFSRALKLYAVSDVLDEVEASRVLSILFDNFKNLPALSYEAETIAIDKLVDELEKESYAAEINLLQLGRYMNRMKTTNDQFKALFGGRITTSAVTETYDMKTIRIDALKKYSDFTTYVLAMAKALETPLFVQALNLLNTARKYYADLLARRTGNNDDKKKPTE